MASPHEDRVLRDGQEPAPEEISLVANRGAWLKRSERSTTPESVEGQAASPSAATASPSTPPAEEEPVKERTSRVAFAPSPEPSESQSSAEASPEASPAPFISRANSNNLATSMVDGLMALEALQQLDGTFDEQPEPEMVDALES